MDTPTLTDYVHIIYTLFEMFVQWQDQSSEPKPGSPFTYAERTMTVFFMIMQFRRVFKFKTQRWARQGVALLTPAYKWVKGRYAAAYHRFIQEPDNAKCFQKRGTTAEPLFDLIAKAIGTTGQQKQLPIQRLPNVRTCLALATLSVQIAMFVKNIWGLPLRNISVMTAAFT